MMQVGINLSIDTDGNIFVKRYRWEYILSFDTGGNIFVNPNRCEYIFSFKPFLCKFSNFDLPPCFRPTWTPQKINVNMTKHIDLKRLMSKDITFCHIINERNPPHRLRTFPSHPAPVRPPLEQPKNRRIN